MTFRFSNQTVFRGALKLKIIKSKLWECSKNGEILTSHCNVKIISFVMFGYIYIAVENKRSKPLLTFLFFYFLCEVRLYLHSCREQKRSLIAEKTTLFKILPFSGQGIT